VTRHTFAVSRAIGIFVGVLAAAGLARGQTDWTPLDDAREGADQIRAALVGNKGDIEHQRSALMLIAEAFKNYDPSTFLEGDVLAKRERELAESFRKTLLAYDPPTGDAVTLALWLQAYGRLLPSPREAAPRLSPYLTEKPRYPAAVTREAAEAVGLILSYNFRQLQRPLLLSADREGEDPARIKAEADEYLKQQGELTDRAGELLKLAAHACGYPDEETRRRGLRAIGAVVTVVQQRFTAPFVAPDRTRTGTESPAEARLIAYLLSHHFLNRLDEVAPSLKSGLNSSDPATRLQAARTASEIALLGDRYRNLANFAGRAPAKEEPGPTGKDMSALIGVLPDVIKRLTDPLPAVRLAAAEAAESAGPRAWPYRAEVAAAAGDRDVIVRWVIARALGRILPEDTSDVAVPLAALISLLHDTDIDVRTSTLASLQRYGRRAVGAIDPVIENINRGDVDVRVVAVDTLERIVADEAKTSDVERAVVALADAVRTGDARVQRQAADALGRIGPAAKTALPVLRQAQHDLDPDLRRKASKAILFIER
jgi:HEAT repeat protein